MMFSVHNYCHLLADYFEHIFGSHFLALNTDFLFILHIVTLMLTLQQTRHLGCSKNVTYIALDYTQIYTVYLINTNEVLESLF